MLERFFSSRYASTCKENYMAELKSGEELKGQLWLKKFVWYLILNFFQSMGASAPAHFFDLKSWSKRVTVNTKIITRTVVLAYKIKTPTRV